MKGIFLGIVRKRAFPPTLRWTHCLEAFKGVRLASMGVDAVWSHNQELVAARSTANRAGGRLGRGSLFLLDARIASNFADRDRCRRFTIRRPSLLLNMDRRWWASSCWWTDRGRIVRTRRGRRRDKARIFHHKDGGISCLQVGRAPWRDVCFGLQWLRNIKSTGLQL